MVPGEVEDRIAGGFAHVCQGFDFRRTQCLGQPFLFVAFVGLDAVEALLDVLSGSGVIVGHRDKSAGHGFEHDVAERFGFAGKEKNVGRCIMAREIFVAAHAGEVNPGILLFESGAQWPIAHNHETGRWHFFADRHKRADRQRDVFFRGDATDKKEHGCVGGGIPFRTQAVVAVIGMKSFGVHPASEQVGVLDAFIFEHFDYLHARCHRRTGPAVDVAQITHRRWLEALEFVLLHVLMEVGVKSGGHRDSQSVGDTHGGNSQRAFGRNVNDIRALLDPAFAQFERSRQTDAHFLVSRQRDGADAGSFGLPIAGTNDAHTMAAVDQPVAQSSQSHGNSVDVRCKSVGNDVHSHDVLCLSCLNYYRNFPKG